MKALKFPFGLDLHGHTDTATTYAELVRGQVIDVLMTNFNERLMRYAYGSDAQSFLFEATDELLRSDAEARMIGRLQQWAPRAVIQSLALEVDAQKPSLVYVKVIYRAGARAEATSLRLPLTRYLDQESAI